MIFAHLKKFLIVNFAGGVNVWMIKLQSHHKPAVLILLEINGIA